MQSYLDHHLANVAMVLDECSGDGRYPTSIQAMWRINISAASKADAAAAELLHLCSFLHADSIPMGLIEAAMAHHWEGSDMDAMRHRLDSAVQVLRRYSLVDGDGNQDVLSMHRLVQHAVKMDMGQATRSRWAFVVVAGVADNIDKVSSEEHYLDRCQVLPHMRLCISHMEEYGVKYDGAVRLIRRCCKDLAASGGSSEACEYVEVGLRKTLDEHGGDSVEYADWLDTYGEVLRLEGQYSKAEPRFKDALAIRERVLEPDHPLIATSLNNLALLYHDQGKYDEALPLLFDALAIQEKSTESNHPDVSS